MQCWGIQGMQLCLLCGRLHEERLAERASQHSALPGGAQHPLVPQPLSGQHLPQPRVTQRRHRRLGELERVVSHEQRSRRVQPSPPRCSTMSDEMKVGTRKLMVGSDAAALAQHAANRMVDAPACPIPGRRLCARR